jgi:hypothetical protein
MYQMGKIKLQNVETGRNCAEIRALHDFRIYRFVYQINVKIVGKWCNHGRFACQRS